MTDPNRRDPRKTGELARAVFENPQVFIETVETGFRSRLRQMSEKVAASGSHIVLLCGPSSSGKTTTANLLVSDLSALGRRAVRISLDDFYRNRDLMPLWEDGTKNFESIEGLDLDCFSESVNTLMRRGHAEFPIFDFTEGRRAPITRPMDTTKIPSSSSRASMPSSRSCGRALPAAISASTSTPIPTMWIRTAASCWMPATSASPAGSSGITCTGAPRRWAPCGCGGTSCGGSCCI